MELETLRKKLLSAARSQPPADRVPYAFAKRIMARLEQSSVPDLPALWARALWRASAPCIALTLLLGVWCFIGARPNSSGGLLESEDLAQHFEQAMLAAVEEPSEEIW